MADIRQRKPAKDPSDQQRTQPVLQQQNEPVILSVKQVACLMVLVFAIFFCGTFMFLNAVYNQRMEELNSFEAQLADGGPYSYILSESFEDNLPSNNSPLKTKQVKTFKYEQSKPHMKELDLPTILWWTDLLYPHSLKGTVSKLQCDVGTCYSTKDKAYLSHNNTRGIMFYGTDFRAYEAPLPRSSNHEWALLHEESPMNNYILAHGNLIKLFNHTATFRRESHFPITTNSLTSLEFLIEREPVPLKEKNSLRRDNSLAPILYLQSHCNVASDRDRYVQELMKYINVDSYGRCLNNKELPPDLKDPVETMNDERLYDFIARYKFHLAFENAICEDYVTEKTFRPLHVGSVPVHRGSPSVRDWMPDDHSVIVVDDFESPKDLAEFIIFLDKNDEEYLKFLNYKKTGVTNNHLREVLERRTWGVNDYHRRSFITDFECYVCDRITERWEAEKKRERNPDALALDPSVAKYNHVGCPQPFIAVGKLEETSVTSDIRMWIEDYWSMYDQAVALNKMLARGYTDSSKLFDVLGEMHNQGGSL